MPSAAAEGRGRASLTCVHPIREVAGRAEVDQLDGGRVQILKQDVLWLEIAVADLHVTQQPEHFEQLLAEVTDQRDPQPLVVLLLEQLEQIDPQLLKDDAQVVPVDEVSA